MRGSQTKTSERKPCDGRRDCAARSNAWVRVHLQASRKGQGERAGAGAEGSRLSHAASAVTARSQPWTPLVACAVRCADRPLHGSRIRCLPHQRHVRLVRISATVRGRPEPSTPGLWGPELPRVEAVLDGTPRGPRGTSRPWWGLQGPASTLCHHPAIGPAAGGKR